jgi:hypothetical protein
LDETPGVLLLLESCTAFDSQGLIAHELGHACTTFEDLLRRGEVDTDEWRSELAADWYAYKWGFGKIIARDRRFRGWAHHGAAPRQRYSVKMDGYWYRYRVTRNFCVRLVGRRKARTN